MHHRNVVNYGLIRLTPALFQALEQYVTCALGQDGVIYITPTPLARVAILM